MTVFCGGAASQAQPGLGATVAIGAGSIAALLSSVPIPWAVPLAGYLGLVTYDLSTFCTGEPPAVPTIGATDVLELITTKDYLAHLQAVQKFTDLVGSFYWNQLCQCVGVPTPPPPTPPAAPTGMPSIDPTVTPVPTTGYCVDVTAALTPSTKTQDCIPQGGQIWDLSGDLFAGPSIAVSRVSGCTTFLAFTLPAGVTGGQVVWKSIAGFSSSRANASVTCTTWTSAGAAAGGGITAMNGSPTNGNTKTTTFVPGTNARYVSLDYSDNTFTSADQLTIEVQLTCAGSGQPSQPCCPPDPILQSQLTSILDLLTLVQRQISPFAYILGPTHSGLTGSGELSVQGLLGAKITPGTPPPYAGLVVGDPNELWLESWVNWGNADGWSERVWLRHSPQISMPAVSGQWTKLGYTLAPGLTVDIQEIVREP